MKKQDLKEIKLIDREIEVLKALNLLGYKWVARNEDNDLFAYVSKPLKKYSSWFNVEHWNFKTFKGAFNFIKWEDKEPTKIDDLIDKGLVVERK